MRIINHIIFVAALVGGIVFAVVNQSFFQVFADVPLYYGTVTLPTNLIIFLAYLGGVFLQWLVAQGAWVFRNKKLERAEQEILRLKAKLYNLTEGSLVDEIKDSIAETRKDLREDIKWLAAQPYYHAAVQLEEGQPERRELPPLLNEG